MNRPNFFTNELKHNTIQLSPIINRNYNCRLNPYVYENNFNYFVKNNIKMQKTRKPIRDFKYDTIDYNQDEKDYTNQFKIETLNSGANKRNKNLSLNIINQMIITNQIPYNEIKNYKNKVLLPISQNNSTKNSNDTDNLFMTKYKYFSPLENEFSNSKSQPKLKRKIYINNKAYSNKENINLFENSTDNFEISLNTINNNKLEENTSSLFKNEKLSLLNNINKKNKRLFSQNEILEKLKENLNIPITERKIELQYKEFRIKMKKPKLFINKIDSFGMKLNNDLSKISKSFGRNEDHYKFADNPILKKNFGIVEDYEVYKSLKFVEIHKRDKKNLVISQINNKSARMDELGSKVYNGYRNDK